MQKATREIVVDPVVRRMLTTMTEKGIAQNQLVEYLGLANGIFTNWKYGGSRTYLKHMDKIAEYLGVTKSFLLGGNEEEVNGYNLSLFEMDLLKQIREMSEDERDYIVKLIQISSEMFKKKRID